MTLGDVQNVLFLDPLPSKLPGIAVVSDFEDAAADVECVAGQEPFDIIAVDRCPAAVAEILAERLCAACSPQGHRQPAASAAKRRAQSPKQFVIHHRPPSISAKRRTSQL